MGVEDHLNPSGLLCAGHAACAYCKKCDTCAYVYPGKPHADICSTPTECQMWVCQQCTAWLRNLQREKETLAVQAPKRKNRKSAVTSEA